MKEKDRIEKRVEELKSYLDNIEFIEKLIKEVETPDRDARKVPNMSRR